MVGRVVSKPFSIGVQGGGLGAAAPLEFSDFRANYHAIFGQTHLFFGQAMEKIAPLICLNETGPVRLCPVVIGISNENGIINPRAIHYKNKICLVHYKTTKQSPEIDIWQSPDSRLKRRF